MSAVELWAGVECTVNRVGDAYFDQLERSGHAHRIDDLDAFAALGIRKLRYPILWERTAPHGRCDFTWADQRMARMRSLGIDPIVGLVHHGSGPVSTSLVDPEFPAKLAAYAGEVARRYPEVLDWTPINEPLTTGRFSGLYGLWYPHGRDLATCFRAVIQQCRGVVLAMKAIREVQPRARLVQTEDLGRVFSTPRLAYQAEYENIRRWLSFDLLFGKLAPDHRLWNDLLATGITEAELRFFLESDVRPDVVGINYYVTSDRYLDERLDRFPVHTHGGNTRHRYADVEAVRALSAGIVGHRSVLTEAWDRYGAPVAITETHLGCTREEQVRWLSEAWEGAQAARVDGADVRAVTVWSLLGAYDWNSLLSRSTGFYETGVFDVRAGSLRPTALANAVRALAIEGRFGHPSLEGSGWWRRPERIHHDAPEAAALRSSASAPVSAPALTCARAGTSSRFILVTGGAGGLARTVAEACHVRGLAHRRLSRSELDVSDGELVERMLDRLRPWAVVNAAGLVSISGSPSDEARLFRDNAVAAAVVAKACASRGTPLVTFSSDHVFDGQKGEPYHERDTVSPITAFGRSKARAERDVAALHEGALVVRSGAIFGPWSQRDFVRDTVQRLAAGHPVYAEENAVVSPSYAPDLVNAVLDLLVDGATGVWNVANAGAVSWFELAREIARMSHLGRGSVLPVSRARASNTALTSERGILLPHVTDGLHRYLREHAFAGRGQGHARSVA